MRHEIISQDLKGLYLLRRRFKKWRQNEWKNHVVYVYGPFDRVWAEEHPLRFSWIKEYMFIYLQTDYEMHWILRIFYRIFWISIFNTCSYGELFTGVSPIVETDRASQKPCWNSTCEGGKLLANNNTASRNDPIAAMCKKFPLCGLRNVPWNLLWHNNGTELW